MRTSHDDTNDPCRWQRDCPKEGSRPQAHLVKRAHDSAQFLSWLWHSPMRDMRAGAAEEAADGPFRDRAERELGPRFFELTDDSSPKRLRRSGQRSDEGDQLLQLLLRQ